MSKILIKNMVCDRCKMVVRDVFSDLNLSPIHVDLGVVELKRSLTSSEKKSLEEALEKVGFAIVDDRRSRLIEQVKTLVVELIHRHNNDLKENLSDYLAEKLHHDYQYISNLFSEVEGITIEKYYITQKIEKVKELLVYDELTLSEIAFQLNYSSVAHLSNQFKKVTGLTPSYFKNIKGLKRQSIDKI